MMVAIFTAISLALAAGRWGPRWFAVLAVLVALVLSTGLFLFEIESPDTGFRMPWLKVERDGVRPMHAGGRA